MVCVSQQRLWFTLHWPPVSHPQKLASLVLMGCRAEEEGAAVRGVAGRVAQVFRSYVCVCLCVYRIF